jgi:hypothetical protein
MAAYADFDFYSETFLGTVIAQADFPRLASRASAWIDRLTYDRAADVVEAETDTDTIKAVQMATCAVAEELQRQEQGGQVQSERVGQHQVTYVTGPVLSDAQRIRQAARLYLASTGLMYGGPEIE